MPEKSEPPYTCSLCSRLVRFRKENRNKNPEGYNGPVKSFGDEKAEFLIVGLAPGLQGANHTGRPFTGDHAGILLYKTLKEYNLMEGNYQAHPEDGIFLKKTMITNAIRCVPPQNKPVAEEAQNCRPYLVQRIQSLYQLKAILCLGRIAHENTCKALDIKRKEAPFKHGIFHEIRHSSKSIRLYNSYHCSRYNTNTRRLTAPMFKAVFQEIKNFLDTEEG